MSHGIVFRIWMDFSLLIWGEKSTKNPEREAKDVKV
jgi:hypothetical protein